ncbi:MAG: hypothetical protein WC188_03585 [Candidatus Caldatribacteriota bacterium]
MSTFADGYSRYLNYNFNYIRKLKEFRKYFFNGTISITSPKFMSDSLLDIKDTIPKYPYFFNAFVRSDSIDIVKIYESSMDNTDVLLEKLIGASELRQKQLYDSIPSLLNNFLAELNFQFSFISSETDLYNYNLIIRSFINETFYRNFFNNLYVPVFYSTDQIEGDTAGLEDKSFIYQYMLYCYIYNVISSSHSFFSKLNNYANYINTILPAGDRIDLDIIIDSFNTFVNTYSNYISNDLCGIVLKSIYKFQNVSDTLTLAVNNIISNKINNIVNGLNVSFYNFLNLNTVYDPVVFLITNLIDHINSLTSADVVSKIYNDSNIIEQVQTLYTTIYEDEKYQQFMSKISQFSFKNYLFMAFLYKFWPMKFLNVLQLTIKEYTENVIKTPNDDFFSIDEFQTLLEYFNSTVINYSNFANFLNTYLLPTPELITHGVGISSTFTFTPGSVNIVCDDLDSYTSVNIHEYIYANGDSREFAGHVISKDFGALTLVLENEYSGMISDPSVTAYKYYFSNTSYFYNIVSNNNISQISCINYYIKLLDGYLTSTYYDTFVEELAEEIFIYLRDNGHLNYDYDWYKYHDVINIYLKTFFRWKLLDNSTRCILSNGSNGGYKFTNGSSVVYCSNKNSYNAISNGDYIFSEKDNIDSAIQVSSHVILGTNYGLVLVSNYTGTTSDINSYDIAYKYNSSDFTLFQDVTYNFENNLVLPVLSNSTFDSIYDVGITTFTDNIIRNFANSIETSLSITSAMKQFIENLTLSTLTRETIYSVLSGFVK